VIAYGKGGVSKSGKSLMSNSWILSPSFLSPSIMDLIHRKLQKNKTLSIYYNSPTRREREITRMNSLQLGKQQNQALSNKGRPIETAKMDRVFLLDLS
jgi:hypothetical protein